MSLFFAKIIRKYTYKFAEKGHFVSIFWGSFAKIIRKYTYKFAKYTYNFGGISA